MTNKRSKSKQRKTGEQEERPLSKKIKKNPSGAKNCNDKQQQGQQQKGKDPIDNSEKAWSKSKKKRMRKIMAKLKNKEQGNASPGQSSSSSDNAPKSHASLSNAPGAEDETLDSAAPNTQGPKKSSMRDAFKARLAGSRFRILNEELYTTTSKESYQRFSDSPELFEQYHDGFRHQVESWPENPVNVIVRSLTTSYKSANRPSCVVADFGCGDAQLAKDLLQVKRIKKSKDDSDNDICPFTVHSFDLVAPNELVTSCDMANVPLPDKSVDVCVFCLSLMGTNLADFIREAHRVLKDNGRVKIAEVRSRIEYSHSSSQQQQQKDGKSQKKQKGASKGSKSSSNNKIEGTVEEFIKVLDKLGFDCIKTDRSNTMFLVMELKKNGKQPDKKLAFTAKPCIYKRR
ncbi:MAG: hypothetical protein SGILL_004046 [Bacillariaceae sp.]